MNAMSREMTKLMARINPELTLMYKLFLSHNNRSDAFLILCGPHMRNIYLSIKYYSELSFDI